jgi:Tol biopolymer transport system component/DNA-binding winged helix-turn-helix (wHTH) protein
MNGLPGGGTRITWTVVAADAPTDENVRPVFRFGTFELDLSTGELTHNGRRVALQDQPARVLCLLVSRAGQLVTREELRRTLWSADTFVEFESALNIVVTKIRHALGDAAAYPRFIETVPKRGYRFIADVHRVEPTNGVGYAEELATDFAASAGPSLAAGQTRQALRWLMPGAVVVMLAAAAALLGTIRFGTTAKDTSQASFRIVALNRLPGTKGPPALSPDGDRVAFTWDRGQGYELHVQSVGFDTTRQLAPSPGGGEFPAWSPDGRTIAFIRRFRNERGHTGDGVLAVPADGGPEQTLWREPGALLGSGLDWSPDGAHVVVPARSSPDEPWRLMLISVSSGQRRWITTPPVKGVGDFHPTYSPDGGSIAFIRDTGTENSLYIVDAARGNATRVSTRSFRIARPAWTVDGRSLIFTDHKGASRNSLWTVSISGGEPEPVTGTGEGAGHSSTARRAERLVFVQTLIDQNLYRAELTDKGGTIVGLAGTSRTDSGPDVSPDGSRLVFVSDRSGHGELWTMDIDGSNPSQITDLRTNPSRPRWSPDGQQITFSAQSTGASHKDIFVINAVGGVPRRLTSDISEDTWGTWSADGRWIYYLKFSHGSADIWKVPATGGRAEQVTRDRGLKAWESSDGRFLYYSNSARELWRVPVDGGDRTLILRFPSETSWGGEWVLSDDGIYWLNVKASPRPSIEFFSFATSGVTRVVTPSKVYDYGGGFSLSRDGRWLVFAQRDYEASDLMMIDGLR